MLAGEATRQALLQNGDRPILHDLFGRSLTARQLMERVDMLAGALLERNLGGATIGLWYRNSFAAVEAFLAVEWVGGTRIAVDPNAQLAEASATFAASGAALVLADHAHAETLGDRAIVHENDEPLAGAPSWPGFAVHPNKPFNLYPRAVSNGKLFAIPFSYGNWDAIMRTNIDLYRCGRFGEWDQDTECFLAAQQIMHATGFLGTFPFLLMGRPQVLVDDFNADRIVEAIERNRVTTTMLVPQMLTRLVDAAERRPGATASLQHVLYGGGPIQIDEIRRALRCLGPVMNQVYGRMEGGWPIAILGIEDHRAVLAGDNRLGSSCGRPIDQVAVRLRPVAGHGPGCGELCVAGEMTVEEYTGADGFCSLGDIMQRDDHGYLFYRGRLDRMINTGYHIYPAEIEEIVASVPGVAAVRVVGEPSHEWGETVVAYIVADAGTLRDEVIEQVKQELSGRLAKYKIPREFRVVNQLPSVG